MYPSNALQTKIFPTTVLGTVSKFDPETKYSESDKIVNEDGILTYVNGVDLMTEIDVEIAMYSNQNIPAPLTNIAFNYANVNGGGNVSYLIEADGVKIIGAAGHVKKIGFKMMTNANLP